MFQDGGSGPHTIYGISLADKGRFDTYPSTVAQDSRKFTGWEKGQSPIFFEMLK